MEVLSEQELPKKLYKEFLSFASLYAKTSLLVTISTFLHYNTPIIARIDSVNDFPSPVYIYASLPCLLPILRFKKMIDKIYASLK